MNEPLRQRKPALSDEKYLARIRELPCCVCGRSGPSDAAHIRMGSAEHDKRETGGQEKPDDCWAVPLCKPVYNIDPVARTLKPDAPSKLVNVGCHGRQHGHDQKVLRDVTKLTDGEKLKLEEGFWRSTGKNPFQIASVLYEKFGTTLTVRRKRRTTITPKGFGRKIENRGFDKTVKRKIPSRKK